MNLWFRFFYLMLTFRFKKPVDPMGECETWFRCWPSDLDLLFHMNNGKYLSIMDLGRIDLMLRSGLWKHVRKLGYLPVVESQTIRYKKSLQLFDKFKILTKVVGWDKKSFFIVQTFVRKNTVVAEAVIKGRFLEKGKGTVNPEKIMKLIGREDVSPEFNEVLNKLHTL